MHRNNVMGAFFFLLKSGLWGPQDKEFCFFPLTESAWTALYKHAKEQTVTGILYDGIQLLAKENLPPTPLRIKWIVEIDQIERSNASLNKRIDEQYVFFSKHGLNPVLLKGQAIAASYPLPLHRVSGDVDWYFDSREQFEFASLELNRSGAAVKAKNDSTVYLWGDCEMDLHNRLFDLYNPFSKHVLTRLRADFPDITLAICTHDIQVLAPCVQLVQATAHILKHCFAFGIGFRQFCDLACLYHKYQNEINGSYLCDLYQKLGLTSWIATVHQMLTTYVGLSASLLPFALQRRVSVDPILNDIWQGGNFGFHDSRYVEQEAGWGFRRKNRSKMLIERMLRYFPYAPREAICFPIAHLLKR